MNTQKITAKDLQSGNAFYRTIKSTVGTVQFIDKMNGSISERDEVLKGTFKSGQEFLAAYRKAFKSKLEFAQDEPIFCKAIITKDVKMAIWLSDFMECAQEID